MSVSRPARYQRPEPETERLFNVTVSFRDEAPDIHIAEVLESQVQAMYQHLGAEEARMKMQPEPGSFYFTAADRIQHIKATLIEKSN